MSSKQNLVARFVALGLLLAATGANPFPAAPADVTADTVHDTRTNLTWQRAFVTGQNWTQAMATCEALNLAGQSDWRLPSAKELATLVEEYASSAPSTIDPALFPGVPNTIFHSSTPNGVNGTGFVWGVSFGSGQTILEAASNLVAVRCVRGG